MFDKKLEYFVALLYAWGSSIASRVCLWSLSASTGDSCSSDFRILAFRSDLRLVGTVIEFSRTYQQTVGLIPMQQEQQQQDALPLQKKSVMHLGRSPAPDRIRPGLQTRILTQNCIRTRIRTRISIPTQNSLLGSWPGARFTKYLTTILRDLTIMPKLRSTYDRRLIHKTSYEGRQAFFQVQFA